MTNRGGECMLAWKEEEGGCRRFVVFIVVAEEDDVTAAVCGRAEDCEDSS